MDTASFINGIGQTLYLYEVITSDAGNTVTGLELEATGGPLELPCAQASSILMVTMYIASIPVTYYKSHNFDFMPGEYTITIDNHGLMEFAGTGNLVFFELVLGDITPMDQKLCY